jgi:hypothetical protein
MAMGRARTVSRRGGPDCAKIVQRGQFQNLLYLLSRHGTRGMQGRELHRWHVSGNCCYRPTTLPRDAPFLLFMHCKDSTVPRAQKSPTVSFDFPW